MEHDFLDRYSDRDSPVHRLDARAKALVAVLFVLTVVSTPPHHLLAFVIYAGLLLWIAARLLWGQFDPTRYAGERPGGGYSTL